MPVANQHKNDTTVSISETEYAKNGHCIPVADPAAG